MVTFMMETEEYSEERLEEKKMGSKEKRMSPYGSNKLGDSLYSS